jgi:hypothetical protein
MHTEFSATVPRLKTLTNSHKIFMVSFSDRLSGCQGVETAKKGDF